MIRLDLPRLNRSSPLVSPHPQSSESQSVYVCVCDSLVTKEKWDCDTPPQLLANTPAAKRPLCRGVGGSCAARTGTRWHEHAAAGPPGTSGSESETSLPSTAGWQCCEGRLLLLLLSQINNMLRGVCVGPLHCHLSARQKSPSCMAGTFVVSVIFL